MNQVGVMQLTDTLAAGGAEQVAVNLANCLPQSRFRTHVCSTRTDGPLAEQIAPHVGRLSLRRRRMFDWAATRTLVDFIRRENVRILHAHGSAILVANLASRFQPYPAIVWHDHFGQNSQRERPVWLYRCLLKRVSEVVAVSQPLADWSRSRLRIPPDRVRLIPNFVTVDAGTGQTENLPGKAGKRIICVANIRPPKDNPTLLEAMALIVREVSDAHLIIVGDETDVGYARVVRAKVAQLGLSANVSLMGYRRDVADLLRQCDVAVLSSCVEALPLVLLEYGLAGLPVVATRVGECPTVLGEGRAGRIVPARNPQALADAAVDLLRDPRERAALAEKFRQRIEEFYSRESVIKQFCQLYDRVIQQRGDTKR